MIRDLSLGELQSLCIKATRGAGRAVGTAEDAGHAVRWLCARGLAGAEALVALLRATDGMANAALVGALPGAMQVDQGALCPLALGGYLSDIDLVPEGRIGPVYAPLLLRPFLDHLPPYGIDIMSESASHTPQVIQMIHRETACPAVHSRAQISDETLAVLQGLAARTYAPETALRRAEGAGAGLSDND
ncbi:DUF3726 domain-containing protein [Gymnodinialimonas sp. 57CJ19]|uniref:DUF3726 domain-containing protein n=1 Tax=Gymnodinialimonas sp. 57CJ19 TaxID=3138498 RepID=UPI0031343821